MATVVKNGGGVLRLPPGFRFHPSDEELVMQYLRKKVYSCPLPASIIPEVDVCKSDPWDLPGDSEQEKYFFSTRETKYPNGNRSNRSTVSGYWKATGIDRQIVAAASTPVKGDLPSNQVVGMKKTLVFYKGKPPSGAKTDWIMHEYRLASTAVSPNPSPQKMNLNKCPVVGMDNWVVCRIFLKKRNTRNDENDVDNRDGGGVGGGKLRVAVAAEGPVRPAYYDFIMTRAARVDGNAAEEVDNDNGRRVRRRCCLADLNLVPASSSSGSSGITEVSSRSDNDNNNGNDSNTKEDDHEESSSHKQVENGQKERKLAF